MSARKKLRRDAQMRRARRTGASLACWGLALGLAACDAEAPEAARGDAGEAGGAGGAGGEGAGGGQGGAGGGGAGGGGAGGGQGGAGGGAGGVGGEGGGACVTTEDHFVEQVWPFMGTTCFACHRVGGVAGETRLLLVAPDGPEAIAADLAALAQVAEPGADGLPLLVAKPTLRHADGHGGGQVVSPGSAQAAVLAELAQRLTGARDACGVPLDGEGPPPVPGADCATAPAGRRTLRRLSHVEYAHTVRDVLGLAVDADAVFAADRVVHGFDNQAEVLTVTGLLADQYRVVAEALAEQVDLATVPRDWPDGAVLARCAQEGRTCASAFIGALGERLFRRPLTGEEIGEYLALYDLAAPDGFERALRWVVSALLQSPHFLYRTELGRRVEDGTFALTPYEIASELSYLFWQTVPDAELFARAADGSLLEAAEVARQVERLLADERSAATMERFVTRWLGLDRLATVPKDAAAYPSLTPALRAAMAEESRRFVRGLWREGAGLSALLVADHTWLDATLAAHYGLTELADGEAPGPDGWRRVAVAGTPYGGVLAQGAFLTTHAKPASSSPVHRGVVVRERLLCQPLPPPPPNLDTSPPPVDPSLSTRERYARHSDDDACRGCHDLIDPLGFAFEHFDGIGRHREQEGAHPVDASGGILGLAGDAQVAVDGVADLAAALAARPEVTACYAEQWVRYGYGVGDVLPLACYAAVVDAEVERLSDAPVALTRLAHFVARTGGEAELDVPGAERVPSRPGEVVDPPEPVDPPEDPPPPAGDVTPGATLSLVENARWQTGYCVQAQVLNTTGANLRWAVAHTIDGTINNLWNASATAMSGATIFTGADWNAEIGPGQVAEFGYCAEL